MTSVIQKSRTDMIYHCDRSITLLRDMDIIHFIWIYLIITFIFPHLDWYKVTLYMQYRKFEDVSNTDKDRLISLSQESEMSVVLIYHCMSLTVLYMYSQTCIKRSTSGQRKRGFLRQVTSQKRFNPYKIFYDMTWHEKGDLLIQTTA